MPQRRRTTIDELRTAIDCLPRVTRLAMLEGIADNEIIVGAYSNSSGICPMLAAHRAGGRTSFIAFAKAWDRFAFRGVRAATARRATARELLILKTHLEASLLDDEGPVAGLAEAVAEHRQLVKRRTREAQRWRRDRLDCAQTRAPEGPAREPADRNRIGELRGRPGWAWISVVRRYDDYRRALACLQTEHPDVSHQPDWEHLPV